MNEYEIARLAIARDGLTVSYIGLAIAAGNMLAAIVAAAGIWVFGHAMKRANENRAETEKNRHEQIMAAFKDAAEDRKAAQAAAAEDRKAAREQAERQAAAAAEDRKAAQAAAAAQMAHQAEQAAEDRKITQATLAALERQGDVLAEILRRTSPTPPPPGPAE